jgi:transcriptional regulator with XRE-family HTH domain
MARLGLKIRLLRRAAGLGLKKVARAGGLSAGHLSSIELGLVNITTETLFAVARGIGLEPLALLADLVDSPLGRLTKKAGRLPPELLQALEERWDEVVGFLQKPRSEPQ